MRKILSLIAVAAVAACSDVPVEPTSHPAGGRLTASADVTGGSDTAVLVALEENTAGGDTTATGDTTSRDTTSGDTTAVAGDSAAAGTATAEPTPASAEPASALEPLFCPSSSEVRSVRGVIGPGGGTIGVRGHELKLPAGAVAEPTEFEIVVPVSEYMRIEVHAVGHDSYLFQRPASITISFQRCASLPASPLTAAYIDAADRIVENMGGAVDRAARKVTFPTGHLSGYIVAF